MNGKKFSDEDKPLYVAPFLSLADRKKQIAHESYNFKASKKRCNLYVRDFPDHTTEQDLWNHF
jgi:hypothetical protein